MRIPRLVVVKLRGGVGNQMFQYAAGRRLSLRHGVQLKLDRSELDQSVKRRYALDRFAGVQAFASDDEVHALTAARHWPGEGFLRQLLRRPEGAPRHVYNERQPFVFDPEVLKLRPPVYLSGSWQCEEYFADVASTIREDFGLRVDPGPTDGDLMTEMGSCASVAVHVRRGDYVSEAHTNAFHGTCTYEYYRAAAEYVAGLVSSPRFYVFSDDPEWVRKHTLFDYPTRYVTHHGPDDGCLDIALMAHCRHHIIANSSFGWWGAWLAEWPGQHVVAPRDWLKTRDVVARDIVPQRWVRM